MLSDKILSCLKAPNQDDEYDIELTADGLVCKKTGKSFPNIDGIPSLFPYDSSNSTHSITQQIKSFYETNPFPNYEGVESFHELIDKVDNNPFAAKFLHSVGYNKMILECGCGTGQLSHYLQLNNNNVLGIDMSLSSLRLAIEHKQRNNLSRSNFVQMNIFDLAIKDNSFDIVISHGVLHHTYDARRAFSEIVKKLKPGGIISVGLYNRYGRIPTWIRSKIIKLFGNKIDSVVRNRISSKVKSDVWIKDQYYNPHETWHSIDETMAWFKENNIEYLNCIPSIQGVEDSGESYFTATSPGTALQRLITQIGWIFNISREGALFILVGRKKEA